MDDRELDSSSPLGLGRMDDDDEIIDLEDVIELPDFDDHMEGGGLGGDDVEILDAESGLVVKGIDMKADEREVDLLSEDFLKSFGTQKEKTSSREPTGGKDPFRDEGESDILDELSLFEKPFSESGSKEQELRDRKGDSDILLPVKDSSGAKAGDDSLELDLDALIEREKASALASGDEKDIADILAIEKSLQEDVAPDGFRQGTMRPAAAEASPMVSAAMPPEALASARSGAQQADFALDSVIEGIESRLLQAVRDVVEARLPELVRTLLREEIDRLSKESKD